MYNEKPRNVRPSSGIIYRLKTIRDALFPIEAYELKKLIPLLIMFSCIAFAYSAFRSIKDAIVMEGDADASVITVVKLLVLPAAFFFKWLYNKLRRFTNDRVTFTLLTLSFLGYFALFVHFYPGQAQRRVEAQMVRQAQMAELRALEEASPSVERTYLQTTVRKLKDGWQETVLTFTERLDQTTFYIMSELWGSVVLSVLFWGFTNSICKMSEPKRFYPLLGCSANLATSFTDRVPTLCRWFAGSKLADNPQNAFAYGVFSNRFYFWLLATCCAVVLACYHWMCAYVLTDPKLCIQTSQEEKKRLKNTKNKVSVMGDSYLRSIGFMVLAYGLMAQLIEIIFKQQLKNYATSLYPIADSSDQELVKATNALVSNYMKNFTGKVTAWSGRIALLLGLFGANSIISHLGWTFAALVTPVVMLTTGALSMGTAIFQAPFKTLSMGMVGIDYLGVWLGGAQVALSKGTKYTLFDSTKEMAYLPLDQETKVAAKAEIDLVGARFGKAGGALYNFSMTKVFFAGNVLGTAGISLFWVLGLGSYWIQSVAQLGVEYNRRAQMKEQQEREAAKVR